jgi:hypothetical protein
MEDPFGAAGAAEVVWLAAIFGIEARTLGGGLPGGVVVSVGFDVRA